MSRAKPQITVFTASVYADVARVWHACASKAFPAGEARLEIFCDSDDEDFQPEWFPGVTLLRRNPQRRDFHEAYNEAVRRVQTPYLAICDSDVYWLSRQIWPSMREKLQEAGLAAVSCISRTVRPSHGTFAVLLKPEIYRRLLERLPEGFFPAAQEMDLNRPMDQWSWYDSGDKISQAVLDAGYRIRFLSLDRSAELVRLQSVTLVRRTAEFLSQPALIEMSAKSRHFWRGYASNLLLRRLHNRLFPQGPNYCFPFSAKPLAEMLHHGPPEEVAWRKELTRDLLRGVQKVARFAERL